MKRILTLAIILIAALAIIVLLIRNKKILDSKKVVSDRSRVPVSVILKKAEVLSVEGTLSLPATLSAREEANVASAASGRIESLNVELGSKVTKGQVIGRLDTRENQIKLQSAELAIEKLQRDYERNQALAAGNATNANAVHDSKYDLDSKKLEADQLRKQISDGNVIAPISGTITEKKMKAGEFASVGATLLTVVDISMLKAQVYVPESSVFALSPGKKASISTEVYPGELFNGTVIYVSPKGDDNHNYLVELVVQNNKASKLKAGVYAIVKFDLGGQQKALQIPKAALVDGIKNPYVYVAKNGKAEERKIVLGREAGENMEVLSGLKVGEQVIISGQINLLNGSVIQSADSTSNK